jgi:hypothetical protein
VSNPTLTPDELHELLGAYAIGAVADPAERSQITSWLADNAGAQAEFDGYVRATSLLHSAEGPSPAVWDAIETAIAQERRPANVASIAHAARRRVRRQLIARTAVAAVAIAAAIAVAVWGVPSDSRSLPTRPASDLQRAAAQATKLAGARRISLVSPSRTGSVRDKVEVVVLPSGQGFVLSGQIAKVARQATRRLVALTGGVTIILAKLSAGVDVTAFRLPEGASQLAVVVGAANVPVVSAVLPTPTPTPNSGTGTGTGTSGTGTPTPPAPTPPVPNITLPSITLPAISLPLLTLPPLRLL